MHSLHQSLCMMGDLISGMCYINPEITWWMLQLPAPVHTSSGTSVFVPLTKLGGVMVWASASLAGRRFKPRLSRTKDFKTGLCCFCAWRWAVKWLCGSFGSAFCRILWVQAKWRHFPQAHWLCLAHLTVLCCHVCSSVCPCLCLSSSLRSCLKKTEEGVL